MPAKPKPTPSVVPLFGRSPEVDVADEVTLGRSLLTEAASAPIHRGPVVDLSGLPKLLAFIGSGNVGKTTLLRFITEITMQRGGSLGLAAVDPENRSLVDYFSDVEVPPSYDPASVARWLKSFLHEVMETKATVAVDFGGGDTSLGQVVASSPDLVAMMTEAGVTPVAFHVLGPRIDDLSPLATFEKAGFQPEATAIVLNEGLADPTVPRERAFAAVLRHSVMKSALARGAVQLWMPRLIPARDVEVRRILFTEARDAIQPDGRRVSPLGPFDRSRVRLWMDSMARELEPIRTWLPA